MKRKIIIFNTLYPPQILGGAELSVQSIAESVNKEFEVTVVTSNDTNVRSDYYLKNVHVIKIPAFNLGYRSNRTKNIFGKILWNILEIWNPLKEFYLYFIIDKIKPDLIHTNNLACISVYIWKVAKLKKIPVVHTLRDKWLLCSRHHMLKNLKSCKGRCLLCKILDLRKKKYSFYVDSVVGISNFILNEHVRYGYFPNSRKIIIHNGVNFSNKNVDFKRSEIKTFGFLGSIADFKGIEVLLEAFSLLKENLKLFIGGDVGNKFSKNLMNKYSSGKIKFLGRVSPDYFFTQIDILVVPSLFDEPFGRVVIESFQHGVPVLANKKGGLIELIKEGETGWFFDAENSRDLRLKILKICNTSNILNMKKKCLYEGEKYETSIMVDKYVEVYNNIFNSN